MREQRPPQLVFGDAPELRLRRVHLRSVGPRAARMDPFDLDHETVDGTAARVLWTLTNTGGKTTLLRLITSVIVPSSRAQMGGANIGEYVDNGDTAHVVLEWESADTGRFVTAAVYEWPNRRRPAGAGSMSDLKKHFYTFRCGPLGVDDLPFSVEGRRRTLEEYRSELREVFSSAGVLLGAASQLGEWAKLLDGQTPLDPELFRYQMRMNDDESGAEALVTRLATPDAVVRFFIQALNDETSVTDFNSTLRDYAQQANLRSSWTTEAAFCQALAAALGPLATAEDRRSDTERERDRCRVVLTELAGQLQRRIQDEQREIDVLDEQIQVDADEEQRLEAQLKRRSDVRQQLLLELARFEAAAAEDARRIAGEERQRAQQDRDAWAVTQQVARLRSARVEVESCQAVYKEAEGELQPLRTATDIAAAALAAKYAALATEADQSALDQATRREEAETAAERAAERQRKAEGEIRSIGHELQAGRELADKVSNHRRRALEAGHLEPDETAEAALQRWEAVIAAGSQRKHDLGSARTELDAAIKTGKAKLTAAEAERAERRDIRRDMEGSRDRYGADLAATAADPDVATVASDIADAELDGARMARTLVEQATELASAAEQRAASLQTELDAIEASLLRFEQGELGSTAEDIETARSTLVDARIGAVTGWEWLERNIHDVDERQTWIETRPGLANGVIITDPAAFGAAQRVLAGASLATRIAVRVVPVGTMSADSSGDVGCVVVPHRALWDRAGAQAMQDELRERRDDLGGRQANAGSTAATYRRGAGRLDVFADQWANTDTADLDAAVATATEAERAADTVCGEFRGVLDESEHQLGALQEELLELGERTAAAKVAVGDCRHLAQLESERATTEEQRPRLEQQLAQARSRATAARAEEVDARGEVKTAIERWSEAWNQARHFRERQAEVGAEPASEADQRPLVDLESEWKGLWAKLQAAEAGSDHAARLDSARKALSAARAEVDDLDAEVCSGAEQRLQRLEGATAASRAAELRHAETQLQQAQTTYATAEARVKTAAETVRDRQPGDRQVYITLPDDWVPVDSDAASALLVRVDNLAATDRAALIEVRSRLDVLRGRIEALSTEIGRYQLAYDRVDAEPLSGMSAFPGTADEAVAGARVAVDEHNTAMQACHIANTAWHDAVGRVRAAVSSPEWSNLDAPIKQRCLNAAAHELAHDARNWESQLGLRTASLLADLEELDKHRHVLVLTLEDLCRTQLRLLAEVTSSSRLPDGLDGLSGQPAFKIDFDRAPPHEARARLAERVDQWAEALAKDPKAAGRGDQRWVWLTDATRDLVRDRPRAGPWTVQVLKPVVDGTVEYRTPDRIRIEFSGGQELTLAVLLYCTLSWVRARNRTGGSRPPGVLLLDNPFGKASNAALIRIQQALAARAGLQLVCATGLADPEVKTAFDGEGGRVLELRNDRDQRHGLQYLRLRDPAIASTVNDAVAGGRDPEDPDGHLDAVAYTVHRP